ncbi:MAG: hypothetical protein IPK82_42535 [Polyangiaceae bacterium]|nr:hypothetical protein [Polyangiaceae bacterium]
MAFYNIAKNGYRALAGRWDLGDGMRIAFELPDARAATCTVSIEGPANMFSAPPPDTGVRTHGADVVTAFFLRLFGAPQAAVSGARVRAGLPGFAIGGAMETDPLAEAERHRERFDEAMVERGLDWAPAAAVEAIEAGPYFYDEDEASEWWEHGIVLVPAGPGALVFRVRLDAAATTLLLEITAAGLQNAGPARTAVLDRAEDLLQETPEIA